MPPHSIDASEADSALTEAEATGAADAAAPAGDAEVAASVPTPEPADAEPRERRRGRGRAARRTDWRLGGRTTARWRERTLGVSLLSLGIGVVGGTALTIFVTAGWAPLAATALLWAGMGVPVIWAFSRSRPVGLLKFRAQDLLFGVVLGILLRTVQGWVDVAAGGSGAFPSFTTIGGALPGGWVFDAVIAPAVIAPVIEEFFFRAIVLVSLYTMLRRALGKLTAGLIAAVVSTGLFVAVHGLVGAISVEDVITLSLLGLVCSLLVLLTGRIWPAVLVHVVYNAAYVALALAGTAIG